jgi:general secretion pathway protein I
VRREGFSLIEALVALAILAVAAVGLIRATEAHVDSVRGLEGRAAAQWVAENRLVELGLRGLAGPDAPVAMLGQRWQVKSRIEATGDPDLKAAHIAVTGAGGIGTTLDGFVDPGTTTLS